jgi:hypothetical protein
MFDKETLMKEMDNYFKNVTKEQFIKDLEKADCLHLVEEDSE